MRNGRVKELIHTVTVTFEISCTVVRLAKSYAVTSEVIGELALFWRLM